MKNLYGSIKLKLPKIFQTPKNDDDCVHKKYADSFKDIHDLHNVLDEATLVRNNVDKVFINEVILNAARS